MTSLLRRKRRTTAPRTPRPATLFKVALLLAALGGPAAAQQPAPRTPPPPTGGSGRVMYFHKPADAGMSAEPGTGSDAAPSTPIAGPGGLLAAPRVAPPLPSGSPVRPTPSALPAFTAAQPGSPPGAAFPTIPPKTAPSGDPTAPTDTVVTRLPPRETIFQMYNDAELERRIARAVREDTIRRAASGTGAETKIPPLDNPTWQLPQLPPVAPPGSVYQPKTVGYEPRVTRIEPTYVVHRRLHFEEKNAERYGWDLGFIQPVVSTLYFYKDTLLWPNSLASGCVHGFWDTSAGKCKPGSPVPYNLYPPGLTVTGTVAEAGLITGLSFIFP